MAKGKQSDVARMLDLAVHITAKGLEGMERQIERVCRELDDADIVDVKLSSHLAWITSEAAKAVTALRMLEKHDRNQAKTPEQRFKLTLEYLKELDPEHQAEVLRVLSGAQRGSVLS